MNGEASFSDKIVLSITKNTAEICFFLCLVYKPDPSKEDALTLLEGKKIVFIGDSILRSIYQDLLCLLGKPMENYILKGKYVEKSLESKCLTRIKKSCHTILYPEYIIPWTTKINQGGINLTFINIGVVDRAESNCRPLPTVKLI